MFECNRPYIEAIDFYLERYIGRRKYILNSNLISTSEPHSTQQKNMYMIALVLTNRYVHCLCALCSYMSIVESLPTYGVHYYAVKVSELIR
jgi:hypothetical protein